MEYFVSEDKNFKGTLEEKKFLLNSHFAFCFAWGLGGSLELPDKEKFDSMVIREQFKIPSGFTTYDYYFDFKGKEK